MTSIVKDMKVKAERGERAHYYTAIGLKMLSKGIVKTASEAREKINPLRKLTIVQLREHYKNL